MLSFSSACAWVGKLDCGNIVCVRAVSSSEIESKRESLLFHFTRESLLDPSPYLTVINYLMIGLCVRALAIEFRSMGEASCALSISFTLGTFALSLFAVCSII